MAKTGSVKWARRKSCIEFFKTHHYGKSLFKSGLGTCDYTPLNLGQTAMQQRPMVPAFSLESQLLSSLSASQQHGDVHLPDSITDDVIGAGLLRATAAADWSQTQGALGDVYGAATQAGDHGHATLSGGSQFTQQFAVGAMPPPLARRRRANHAQGGSSSGSATGEQARRRESTAAAARAARARKVVIYRSYRDGELPDIEGLAPRDVLRPLSHLCLLDENLASIMFSFIFNNLYLREAPLQRQNLAHSLQTMLQQSPGETSLVAALHATSLKIMAASAEMERSGGQGGDGDGEPPPVEAAVIAESSLKSYNFHSGIAVLEQSLLKRGERAKEDGASDASQDAWFQLARLYAALGERDVLVGLTARAARNEETHRALQYELEGQYGKAIGLYNRCIERQQKLSGKGRGSSSAEDEEDPGAGEEEEEGGGLSFELASEAEHTTWLQRTLECCRQLGEWGQVHDACLNSVADHNDPQSLWEGSLREWALPAFVRSLVALPAYHPELKSFFEESLAHTEKRAWLEANMPAELAASAALDHDFGTVVHYVRPTFSIFFFLPFIVLPAVPAT